MSAPTEALRPTRVLMETDVHLVVLRTFAASDPNASAPNVRLSPIIKRFPWPFALISGGLAVALEVGEMITSARTSNAAPMDGIGPDLKGRRGIHDIYLLWQSGGMLRRHFLTYLSLSTMAITQPLLELYAKNITIFSAAKVSSFEASVFIGVVAFVPALCCAFIDRFSSVLGPKVNESVRLVLIASLSLLLGFGVARWLRPDGNVFSIFVGIAFSIAVPIAFDRSKAIRVWSHWMSVLSIAVVAGVVVAAWPVLAETNGPTSDAIVRNKAVTVLQVIFDEFPLFPLLDDEGRINGVRFPGFAELAENATWYRNSTAVSNMTTFAVPAILSSQFPNQSEGPYLSKYRKNIFTLYGGRTSVSGTEPITSLCPHAVCVDRQRDSAIFDFLRIKSFFRDAMFVYGHRVFPPFIRRNIPSIEGNWGGVENWGRTLEQMAKGALSPVEAVEQAVKSVAGGDSAQIQVVHALLPHGPWTLTPDLRVSDRSPVEYGNNPVDDLRKTYQTFLYKVGAADQVMKNLIHDLKASGKWDSTLLVVTADHGISFEPNMPRRETDFSNSDQVSDIYRIPTFIKYPHQSLGSVDDCAISNLDLLPTIIDVTQTTTSWKFSGQSIARTCPIGRVRHVMAWKFSGQTPVMDSGFEEVRNRANHYSKLVSNDGPLNNIAAVGESASLIGTAIGDVPEDGRIVSWALQQKDLFSNISSQRGSRVPALVTGTIAVSSPLEVGTEGIIAVDGIAAGVVDGLSGATAAIEYTAVLDYTLLTAGSHTIQLYIRGTDGKLTSAGAPD